MRHIVACSCFVALGCEAIVPVDIHYSDGGPVDVGIATDAATIDEGDAIGPGGLCACGSDDAGAPFTSGDGCCIPQGSDPFCTGDNTNCAGSGGLFIGCQSSSTDNPCCWSNLSASGSGAEIAAAATCGQRPLSCTSTADCQGTGACLLASCRGLTIGACGFQPTCP